MYLIQVTTGRMDVTADNIYFFVERENTTVMSKPQQSKQGHDDDHSAATDNRDRKWQMIGLLGVQQRTYLLTPNALEMFFVDNRAYLFAFPNHKTQQKILSTLRRIK